MKKILFLTLLGMQSLSAYIHPEAGSFAVQGEFLYLLPSVDDTFYVTEGSTVSTDSMSTKRNNDFTFTPGFRVEGAYGFCNESELIVRYARLRATQSESIAGFLGPVRSRFQNTASNTTSSYNLDLLYQNVDLLYGMGIWNSCKFNLELQAGVEYAYIRLNEQVHYFGNAVINDLHEKTWGIGPQIGLGFNWNLYEFTCNCPGKLSFVSRASTSLLVSETDFKLQALVEDDSFFNVKDDSTWRIVPAFHARLGFNYETCISCFNASFEIGYEFHNYLRAVSREIFNGGAVSSNSWSNYNNFDAHGLYVALGLGF